jgi:hypothetical protein
MSRTYGTNGVEEEHIGYWCKIQKKKTPLGNPGCMWVDNIRLDLGEIR